MALFGKASFDGREASFVVKECLPEDAGAYTCLLENRAGKTSCCAAVFVRGQLLEGINADFYLFLSVLQHVSHTGAEIVEESFMK